MNETTDAIIVREATPPDLMFREPEEVLREASRAAKALQGVVESKPKKLTLGGKTYLTCEDWLTIGAFFNCTAEVDWSRPITVRDANGWEARVLVKRLDTGQVVGGAESMCLDCEDNWQGKPDFQIRSMAQTRAMSKALAARFRWVSVLAGYEGTPAEEMEGVTPRSEPRTVTPPQRKSESNGRHINERQVALLFGKAKAKFGAKDYVAALRDHIAQEFGLERETELTNEQLNAVLSWLNG